MKVGKRLGKKGLGLVEGVWDKRKMEGLNKEYYVYEIIEQIL